LRSLIAFLKAENTAVQVAVHPWELAQLEAPRGGGTAPP